MVKSPRCISCTAQAVECSGATAISAGILVQASHSYAFRSRGLDGQEELTTIDALADAYLADLRAFQPQGPYCLGGYCFRGRGGSCDGLQASRCRRGSAVSRSDQFHRSELQLLPFQVDAPHCDSVCPERPATELLRVASPPGKSRSVPVLENPRYKQAPLPRFAAGGSHGLRSHGPARGLARPSQVL